MYQIAGLVILFFCHIVQGVLWPSGVVHFSVNKKDYDPNSHEIILSTLATIEKEICVKFFHSPLNNTATQREKILYINNNEKKKECTPAKFDFSGHIVHMTIGYKCINPKAIAKVVTDMLRASVSQSVSEISSNDLIKKFREEKQKADPTGSTLLPSADRNYINAHYVHECAKLSTRHGLDPSYRRSASLADDDTNPSDLDTMTAENLEYYSSKLWPLGVVIYDVETDLAKTEDYATLKQAMTTIELDSCIVFQEATDDGMLEAKNMITFTGNSSGDVLQLGYREGKQSVNLHEFTNGAPGHASHTLNNLMRLLGVPMASNRPDRDNYVTIEWKNVEKGKEHLLEKAPRGAWLRSQPYDFESVTHAPANYACGQPCKNGGQSVKPVHDLLWQRTLSMGHTTELSPIDIAYLKILYGNQCQYRLLPNPGALKDSQTGSKNSELEEWQVQSFPKVFPLVNKTVYDNFKVTSIPLSTPWRPWLQTDTLVFHTERDVSNVKKKLVDSSPQGRLRWG